MGNLGKGTYLARATGAVIGETSTGKETVAIEFEILTEGFKGEKITWWGFFTEKTTERTLAALRYCGWSGGDIFDLSGISANEVELVLDFETYEGNQNLKVKWINKPGNGPSVTAQLTPEKAAAFRERMRQASIVFDVKSGGAPKAPAPTNSTKDIPF